VQDDSNGVDSAIRSVTASGDQLNKDLSDYRQAAAAMPTYAPASAPDAGAIQSQQADATKQTSAWKAKTTQYQNQVAQLVSQANDVAARAEDQYC
jgi:hypothetical protein